MVEAPIADVKVGNGYSCRNSAFCTKHFSTLYQDANFLPVEKKLENFIQVAN